MGEITRGERLQIMLTAAELKALDDWRVAPVVDRMAAVRASKFSPDEPVWWGAQDSRAIGEKDGSLREADSGSGQERQERSQ